MSLTVLTDADVNAVLFSLTRDDVLRLHMSLAEAMHSYSTATTLEDSGCCSSNQPERISVKDKNGSTTLFMPSISDNAKGVKIVTLSESSNTTTSSSITPDMQSLSMSETQSSASTLSSSPSATPSSPSTSRISFAEPASPRGSPSRNSRSIYRTSRTYSNPSLSNPPAPASTSPKGSITLMDAYGNPRALVNASTLTAFRTALASTLMLKARDSVHTVTCFGAGAQAFWHIYLTFLLRGSEVHHLHVINRSFDRATSLIRSLARCLNPTISSHFSSSKLQPDILTPSFGEYSRLLKEHVRAAEVIYCCTPSTEPLFPGSFLTSSTAHNKGRYIAAIGSYKPHMQEIPVEVVQQAVRPPSSHAHHGIHHRHSTEGGAIVVDTIDGAFKEAGEVISSGISAEHVVELGEVVMLMKAWNSDPNSTVLKKWNAEGERQGRKGSRSRSRETSEERTRANNGLTSWLEKGNVVYKSVGLGLMDVVTGMEIVKLAEARGVGTTIHGF